MLPYVFDLKMFAHLKPFLFLFVDIFYTAGEQLFLNSHGVLNLNFFHIGEVTDSVDAALPSNEVTSVVDDDVLVLE